jgi:CheY-like chemotaxis protein
MPVKNLRLLILDDSPEDRTVVRFMLEEAPGRTWQFIDEEKGADALRLLEREAVDCILLDYHLPDMNGVRFLRELTKRFGPLGFPVVVFTGADRASLRELALQAGAYDYLAKDMIGTDSLVRAIDNSIKQFHFLRETQKICVPVLVTDAKTSSPGPCIVFVNRAFTALTGYSESDVMGKSPAVLQGPKTSRDVLARMRLAAILSVVGDPARKWPSLPW